MLNLKKGMQFASASLQPHNVDLFKHRLHDVETVGKNSLAVETTGKRPVELGSVVCRHPDVESFYGTDGPQKRLDLWMRQIWNLRQT